MDWGWGLIQSLINLASIQKALYYTLRYIVEQFFINQKLYIKYLINIKIKDLKNIKNKQLFYKKE